ncbi:MAG: HAMP domain-containing histidine kinase [Duncaniella sp.]|nr:HAMP domain-containing histidine kinase [Duncaniella sp.]MDE6178205.1 HAMP domain-containing histidine kinase [Duncaniella sp.]
MRHIATALLLSLAVLTASGGIFSAERHREVIDSLRRALSQASEPSDSMVIYSNIYDVSHLSRQRALGDTIYGLAERIDDQATALDIIRNMANRNFSNDSILGVLRKRTLSWPETQDRKETMLFIDMMENVSHGRYGTQETRDKMLKKVVRDIYESHEHDDLYERVRLLHAVCMLLSNGTNSELLAVYEDTLGTLVRRLPPSSYSIRNAYNIHAAMAYAGIDPAKSIECDRWILANIEKLARYYHKRGRVFRNYAPTYYTVYSRLLSNYESLAPSQIEDYYAGVMELVKTDPSIEATYLKFPRADIYYALWKKEWKRASELIMKSDVPEAQRFELYRRLIQCADSIGDADMHEKAAVKYVGLLENELKARASDSYRELQIAYAINDIRHRYHKLDRDRLESLSKMQLWVMAFGFVAIAVLVVLVILLFIKQRSNKALARSLAESNSQLKKERDSLRLSREDLIKAKAQAEKANNLKTDFIKNMSYEVKVPLQAITEYSRLIADCAQAAGSKHISRFADMLELNTELLTTIVDDVLRLSDIESSPMPVHRQVVQLKTFCNATIMAMRHRVADGVSIQVDPEAPDADFFTDPARVQQILNNLLTNAAKFTQRGSITLGYRILPLSGDLEMSVTDTGIGINPENKEKIFQRFTKLDRDTQGAGLGLTIARLVAERLGGRLELDTAYKGQGSRFVLTLPKQ